MLQKLKLGTISSYVTLALSLQHCFALIFAIFAVVSAELVVEESGLLDALVRRFEASFVNAWVSSQIRRYLLVSGQMLSLLGVDLVVEPLRRADLIKLCERRLKLGE